MLLSEKTYDQDCQKGPDRVSLEKDLDQVLAQKVEI